MKYLNDFSQVLEQFISINDHKQIVEIGVCDGWSTVALCNAANKTGGKVYGYDLWDTHGIFNQFASMASKSKVQALCESYNFTNFELHQKNTRDPDFSDFLKKTTGGLVDFAFIDGCHSYAGALNDLQAVYPLLSNTGIVAFHDTLMIDGCRELMIDLRTKYFDGTFDIIDFFGGNVNGGKAGLSFLVKRQFPVIGYPIRESCGSLSEINDIIKKETTWYETEILKYKDAVKILDVDVEQLEMKLDKNFNRGRPL